MAEPARSEPTAGAGAPAERRSRRRAHNDSMIALADDTRRYGDERQARRAPIRTRSLRAYWTTFVVIGSYLWLRFRARLHSDAWVDNALHRVHLRNARRIERTICALQGLFIKVGQLISIMTNFLPEAF